MLIALLTPFALGAQSWTVASNTDIAALIQAGEEKDKPILKSPTQVGNTLMLQWESSLGKTKDAHYEVRLYETLPSDKGEVLPNLAQKPLLADIIRSTQYEVNGNSLGLRDGQSYCFVITPTHALAPMPSDLADNATVSSVLVWKGGSQVGEYPVCPKPTSLTMNQNEVTIGGAIVRWGTIVSSDIDHFIISYRPYKDYFEIPPSPLTDITVAYAGTVNNQYTVTGLDYSDYTFTVNTVCKGNVLSDPTNTWGNVKTLDPCESVAINVAYNNECGAKVNLTPKPNTTISGLLLVTGADNEVVAEVGPSQIVANSYTFKDLEQGKTYTCIVNYECSQSRTRERTVSQAFTVEAACFAPKIASLTPCGVTLAWSNPGNNACDKIEAIAADGTITTYQLNKQVLSSYPLTNLPKSPKFRFKLSYLCGGEGSPINVLSFPETTIPLPCPTPDVSLEVVGTNFARILLNDPTGANRAMDICYTPSLYPDKTRYQSGGLIPNLEPLTTYTFYIAFNDCANDCAPSSCGGVAIKTLTMPCARPDVIRTTQLTKNSIGITWQQSLMATVGYRKVGDINFTQSPQLYDGVFSINAGLLPNTEYEFSVAYQNCNNALTTIIKTPATDVCLGNPTKAQVALLDIKQTTARLQIIEFPLNNEYECEYKVRNSPTVVWTSVLLNVSNNFTLSSLSPDVTYDLRIRRFVPAGGTMCDWLLLDPFTTEDLICPAFILDGMQYLTTDNSITLTWTDRKNPKTYNIRYRVDQTTEWTTVQVQGLTHTISGLLNNTTYEMEMQRACNGSSSVDWVVLKKQETKTKISTGLPPLDCGQAVTLPTPANTDALLPLEKLTIGDRLYYNGLALVVITINGTTTANPNSSSTQPFSGTGEMALPFGKKKVKVTFSNIKVNRVQIISEGLFTAVTQGTLPSMTASDLNLNSFTCVKPPPKSNTNPDGTIKYPDIHGFDKDGKYVGTPPNCQSPTDQTDPLRDPRGFDKNGNHVSNNGKYDGNGCDVDGLTVDKQPCPCYKPCVCTGIKPYAWLNSNANVTNEGNTFAQEQKGQIVQWVPIILDALKTSTEGQITTIVGNCDALRTPLGTQQGTLGYNRILTFGQNDKYLIENMNQEFTTKPIALTAGTSGRKTGADVFEAKHIDLYTCDLDLAKNRAYYDLIDFYRTNEAERKKIEDYVFEQARRLSKEDVEKFKNSTEFKAWVETKINEFLKAAFDLKHGKRFGYQENRLHKTTEPGFPPLEKPWIPPYQNGLATNSNDLQWIKESAVNNLTDAAFQYNQGWEYINGVHRTEFMDAMISARGLMEMVDEAETMPMSFSKKDPADNTYTIYLDNLVFNNVEAKIDVYLVITLQDGQRIVFRGEAIAFNGSGLILLPNETSKLYLDTDIAYGINQVARIVLKGKNKKTYAEWNCEGFAGLHTELDVQFCRQYMKPLDANQNVIADPAAMVTLSTELDMTNWGDFEVTIAGKGMNFVMTGYEDYKIKVADIIIDNSTTKTHNSAITFPNNYASADVEVNKTVTPNTATAKPTWKGIFIGNISVTMPSEVFKLENNGKVEIGVKKMIIDNEGVTGTIFTEFGTHLIPLDKGNLGGWAYSVDGFHLNILHNHLVGGGFDGLLNVPILSGKDKTSKSTIISPDDCFEYSADFMPGLNKFTFSVENGKEKVFRSEMLRSKVTLADNSRVDLVLQDGNFTATAVLHGEISLDVELDKSKPKLSLGALSMKFDDLTLSNKAPRFKGGKFHVSTEPPPFKNFKLTYHTSAVRDLPGDDKLAAMDLDVDFKLTQEIDSKKPDGTVVAGKDPTYLAAHGGFQIRGVMEEDGNKRQRFVYKDFGVKSVEIDGSFPGVAKLHGYVKFFDESTPSLDPAFGEGFQGGIDIKFDKLGFQAKAVGLFGNVAGYKYFCVDAMLYKKGLATIGPMDINGFGGGVNYHMKRNEDKFNDFKLGENTPIPTTIGESLTGINYLPDSEQSIGIRAMLAFSLAKAETAANGNLMFGVEFSKGGGLDEIRLMGNADIMTPVKLPKPVAKFVENGGDPQTASIRASVDLVLKFGKKPVFDCATKVYMNIGNGLIVGKNTGAPDLMGGLEIHVGDDGWWFNLGEPDKGKRVSIGLSSPAVTLSTYMDIGSKIPAMPELPDFITRAFGTGYKASAQSLRQSGGGFAFGANLSINTGDKKFLIFYGKFQADLGFDIMLKDYGKTTTCSNLNNEPIGMNGWYATGQMYAGVQAEIGLKWKSIRYPILNMYAAAALQAKMPNPFWAQGTVGGSYSILGGAKKGSCNFQFTIGEECVVTNTAGVNQSLVASLNDIVASVTPTDKDEAMLPLAPISMEFNYPINTTYEDEDTGTKYFAQFAETPTLKTKDGYRVSYYPSYPNEEAKKEEGNVDNTRLDLVLDEMLQGNTEYELSYKAIITVNNSPIAAKTEEKTISFKTTAADMTMPRDNIFATYPQDGQYNFYLNELSDQKGFIKLRLRQNYLFAKNDNGKKVVHRMKFTAKSGACFMTNVEEPKNLQAQGGTKDAKSVIYFAMPAAKFTKEIYRMDLITIAESDDSPTACLPDAKVIRNLYTGYFRTSNYNTSTDKIKAAFGGQTQTQPQDPKEKIKLPKATNVEPFDQFEMLGFNKNKPAFEITTDYKQDLPDLLLTAFNSLAGDKPFQIEIDKTKGSATLKKTYTLSFSYPKESDGGRSANRSSGERAVVAGGFAALFQGANQLRLIQEKEKLPVISATDFSGTATAFTQPQYLRFDAVNSVWDQFRALQRGVFNMKIDMVNDLVKAGIFSEKDAAEYIEKDLLKGDEYASIRFISKYEVEEIIGNIPARATYKPVSQDFGRDTDFND
jgi:hypothetical protein